MNSTGPTLQPAAAPQGGGSSPDQPAAAGDGLSRALDLAREAHRRRDFAALAPAARSAIDLARGRDDARLGLALTLLAEATWRLGQPEEAVQAGREAVPLLDLEHLAGERSQALCVLTMACRELGLHGEALEHGMQGLLAARRSGDALRLSWSQNRIGVAHDGLGDGAEAERWLLLALASAHSTGDAEAEFSALINHVAVSVNRVRRVESGEPGDPGDRAAVLASAASHAAQARALAQRSGSAHWRAVSAASAALVHAMQGQHDEAAACLDQAEAICLEQGLDAVLLGCRVDRAQILRLRGDTAEAVRALRDLLPLAIAQEAGSLVLESHRALYEMLREQGDWAAALEQHEALHRLEVARLEQRAQTRTRLLTGRLDVDLARSEAERARLDAEVQRLRNLALAAEVEQLSRRERDAERRAHEDGLTGLANRRRLDAELPLRLARAATPPPCVALLDLDHFKRINDVHGHGIGDEVLRRTARLLTESTRPADLIARAGGEEFVIAFDATEPEAARAVCERLRRAIAEADWSPVAPGLAVTISIGLAQAIAGDDAASWLARADRALYAAKRGGRDRVQWAEVAPP